MTTEQDPMSGSATDLSLGNTLAETGQRRFQTLRRFARHKVAVACVLFMSVLIIACFPLAPIIAPLDPNHLVLTEVGQPPSRTHLLGTDMVGRDVWSRIVYGGRVSLSVGLVAVSIYITIGTTLGSLAGFYRGWIDTIIMRITDTVMSFPVLIILISIVAIIGPGLFNAMLAIGLIAWTGIARLVRGQILSIREMDFVTAATMLGVPEKRIIVRHVLPNVVAPITVAASFGVAGAILTEAGLSFLGLGVQPPTASWGSMINEARGLVVIEGYPWLWIVPGVMISLCVLAINFIGDGLRDALDPHMLVE